MKTEELRNKIIDKLNDHKIRIEGDDRDESYNFGIDICIDCVEDSFKEYEESKKEGE